MSQEALALESGVDRTFVSQIERGVRQPTLTTLFRLCDALAVHPSDVIASVEKRLAQKR